MLIQVSKIQFVEADDVVGVSIDHVEDIIIRLRGHSEDMCVSLEHAIREIDVEDYFLLVVHAILMRKNVF